MPNKSNPDVVELLRGSVAIVDSAIHEIQSVISLPSGYHRDLQLTKPPMIRGMQTALRALSIVPQLVEGLSFRTENMRKSISKEMFATDHAIRNAAAGVPFREAYLKAKEELAHSNGINAEESLAQRLSPGASGDLRLDGIGRHLSLETDKLLALKSDSS